MPIPVLGNSNVATGLLAHGGGTNWSHGGGRVLVIWFGARSAPNAGYVNTVTITHSVLGAQANTLLTSLTWATPGTQMRVWKSDNSLPSGTITITASNSTGSNVWGSLFGISITFWDGTIGTPVLGPTDGTVDLSHDVPSMTSNDRAFAGFVYSDGDTLGGQLLQTGGSTGVSGGNANSPSTATHGEGYTFTTMTRTGTGTLTVACTTGTGWTTTLTGLSMAFRLIGTVPFTQSVSGSLSFSGANTRAKVAAKTLTGSLSFSGDGTKQALLQKALDGNLAFVGFIDRAALLLKELEGSLSFSGVFSQILDKQVAGVLDFDGETMAELEMVMQDVEGSVSFSGDLTVERGIRQVVLEGVLSFLGTLLPFLRPITSRFTVPAMQNSRYKRFKG